MLCDVVSSYYYSVECEYKIFLPGLAVKYCLCRLSFRNRVTRFSAPTSRDLLLKQFFSFKKFLKHEFLRILIRDFVTDNENHGSNNQKQ